MKKKNRLIEANITLKLRIFIDEETNPEEVLNTQNLFINSEMGMITETKIVNTDITRDENLVCVR